MIFGPDFVTHAQAESIGAKTLQFFLRQSMCPRMRSMTHCAKGLHPRWRRSTRIQPRELLLFLTGASAAGIGDRSREVEIALVLNELRDRDSKACFIG